LTEKLIDTNSEIQKTTILLKGLSTASTDTGRGADAANDYAYILKTASSAPFSLGAITDTFVKMKTAGIDPTKIAMQGLIDAVAAFGGDDSRLKRASYAIQEMAGRGVLSLSNLRRQLGQDIPGAERAMADALNMSLPELFKKVQTGSMESASAIERMTAEMERMYGGAAQTMMNTYQGKVQQLKTSLVELATIAGGQNNLNKPLDRGETQGASFYGSVTTGVGKLNDYLQSPDATAAAVDLNNALAAVAKNVTAITLSMIEWRRTIVDVAEAIALVAGGYVAIKAIALGIAAIKGIIGGVTLAVNALTTGTLALVGFSTRAAAAIANISRVAVLATSIMGLGTTITSVAGSLALLSGVGALVVGVGLAAWAIYTAVTFRDLKTSAVDAHEAIDRLRSGDVSNNNLDASSKEIDANAYKVKEATSLRDNIAKARSGSSSDEELYNLSRQMYQDRGGFGNVENVRGVSNFSGKLDAQSANGGVLQDRLTKYINAADPVTSLEKADQESGNQANLNKTAAATLKGIDDELAKHMQEASASYRAFIKGTSDGGKIKLDDGDGNTENLNSNGFEARLQKSTQNHDTAGTAALDQEHYAQAELLRQRETDAVKASLDKVNALKKDAGDQGNEQQVRIYQTESDKLQSHLNDLQHKWAILNAELLKPSTGGEAGNYEKEEKAAGSQLDTLSARVAQLKSQSDSSWDALANNSGVKTVETNYARVSQAIFGVNGRLSELGKKDPQGNISSVATQLLAMADAADRAASEQALLTKGADGMEKMRSEYEAAAAQVDAYAMRINNPTLSDAQVQVALRNEHLADTVYTLGQALAGAVPGTEAWTKAWQALSNAQAGADMTKKLEDQAAAMKLISEQQGKINSANEKGLTGGALAGERKKQAGQTLNEQQATIQNALNGMSPTDPNYAAMKAGLAGATNEFNATVGGINREASASAAKAQKPVDNFITDLQEKIKGFQATIAGADASEAKFMERMKDESALKGHSAQLSVLIKQYGDFKEKAELASKATAAVQKVGELRDTAQGTVDTFTDDTKLYPTELQKEFAKNQEEINKQIAIMEKAINGGAYSANPAALAAANAELAKTQQTLQTMNNASLVTQLDDMRKQVTTDKQANKNDGGAGDLAEMNAQASQVQGGINSMFGTNDTALDQDTLNKKKAMETDLSNWVQDKQKDIYEANKSQLEKTAEGWGDWEKMIGTDASSLFESL
ncbi:MAG: tape measure protein, partial [Janthinobacterium lividum]